VLQKERDEQAADAAIAVKVRLNRLELDVHEPGADEWAAGCGVLRQYSRQRGNQSRRSHIGVRTKSFRASNGQSMSIPLRLKPDRKTKWSPRPRLNR
jgi:hypothetical protein